MRSTILTFSARSAFATASAVVALAMVSGLSGCVVNSSRRLATIEVDWAPQSGYSCATVGVSTVAIRLTGSNGSVRDLTVQCERLTQQISVEEGTYTVTVDGIGPGGNLVVQGPAQTVYASAGSIQLTSLVIFPAPAPITPSSGSVDIAWTVLGQAPAAACGKYGVQSVTVTVLDATRTKVDASAEVACTTGSVIIDFVPPGTHYLRLDGRTQQNVLQFGTINDYGPITVTAGVKTFVQNALNIADLRSAVSLDWVFADGGNCSTHNVTTVKIQITDGAGKIIVPYDDAAATKPCNLNGASELQRIIDLQSVAPTCAVPPGAKGLIICNVLQDKLNVSVLAFDATTGAPSYGGGFGIANIPISAHLPLNQPMVLSLCNNSSNKCVAN